MTNPRETFRRYERLTKKKDIERILSLRQIIRSTPFNVYYEMGESEERQGGLTVSRKVASKATERTRIKRRLREIFRRNKGLLADGTKIFFRANTAIKNYGFAELENTFRQLVERMNQRTRQEKGAWQHDR